MCVTPRTCLTFVLLSKLFQVTTVRHKAHVHHGDVAATCVTPPLPGPPVPPIDGNTHHLHLMTPIKAWWPTNGWIVTGGDGWRSAARRQGNAVEEGMGGRMSVAVAGCTGQGFRRPTVSARASYVMSRQNMTLTHFAAEATKGISFVRRGNSRSGKLESDNTKFVAHHECPHAARHRLGHHPLSTSPRRRSLSTGFLRSEDDPAPRSDAAVGGARSSLTQHPDALLILTCTASHASPPKKEAKQTGVWRNRH
ncbi:hypothetical protein E2C01_020896 [Portunus trituberculatus]|uniref:Secreted protein n=1 Tax=Portunus trituberculatus TaxID=210409 RepID=A0A5B7E1U0_PORTR|nr:hypothetical protein [Portunus trituberculatus]